MPTARRSRTIAAPTGALWSLIGDPHHLPRWWPRVTRVEDVSERAFTEVLTTAKGRIVRADFELVEQDEQAHVLCWAQLLEGSPFARLLSSAETEVRLDGAGEMPPETEVRLDGAGEMPAGAAMTTVAAELTTVTIELRQSLQGFFSRFGAYMVRRAALKTIDEALDGLERIVG